MQARKDGENYWLMFSKGEELVSSINSWAKAEKITGAAIYGICALTGVDMILYDPKKNEVIKRHFDGFWDVLSLMGNISEDGMHAHLVMADENFNISGGHIMKGTISVVGEFFVTKTNPLLKVPLEGTAFKKIDLGKK